MCIWVIYLTLFISLPAKTKESHPDRYMKPTFKYKKDARGNLQSVEHLWYKALCSVPFDFIRCNNYMFFMPYKNSLLLFFLNAPFSTCTCAGLLSHSLFSQHHSSSAGLKVKDLLTWPPHITDCSVTRVWLCKDACHALAAHHWFSWRSVKTFTV